MKNLISVVLIGLVLVLSNAGGVCVRFVQCVVDVKVESGPVNFWFLDCQGGSW